VNPLPRVWCPTCKRMVNAMEVRQDGHHEKLVFDKVLHGGHTGRWVTCKLPTQPKEPKP
jgi:hypothetical protein